LHPARRGLAVAAPGVHRHARARRGPGPRRPSGRPGAPGGRCRGDRPMTDDARTNGARAGEPEEARDRPADAAPSGDPATFLRSRSVWARLYHGETTVDFVGRWRIWFGLSAAVILVGVVAFVVRGGHLGLPGSTVQELESGEGRSIRMEAEPVDPATSDGITATRAELAGTPGDDVVLDEVGPSWGRETSEKALRALVVFLVLVT